MKGTENTGAVRHPLLETLARVYWMAVGPGAMGIMMMVMFREGGGNPQLDAIFWGVVASLLAVRFLDIRYLHGMTGDNKPATMAHFKRYSMGLVAVGVALWGVGRFVIAGG